MADQSHTKHSKLLRRKVVEDRVAMGRTEIYDGVARGTFPAPLRVGRRAVRWLESDIEDWIAGKVEQSELKDDRALGDGKAGPLPQIQAQQSHTRRHRSSGHGR